MSEGFFRELFFRIFNFGKAKVVGYYLIFATSCVGLSSISIDANTYKITIEFGTLDWFIVTILAMGLIPVVLLLCGKQSSLPQNNQQSIFEQLYLPKFEKIFTLLNIDKYSEWAYYLFVADLKVSTKLYEDLNELIRFINCRSKEKSILRLEKLMDNLGLLVTDLLSLLNEHLTQCGSHYYTIERFYKTRYNGYNPNYAKDLKEYNDLCILINALGMELTRLLNLILKEIRKEQPNYLLAIGYLSIDSALLQYRESEISEAPYPGIEKFKSIRFAQKK